jgi:hypothetical protein
MEKASGQEKFDSSGETVTLQMAHGEIHAVSRTQPLSVATTPRGAQRHADSPIIVFTDSSFQDSPDTCRSTGGYLIFIQGAVVDVTSTMPSIVAQSTCEAEY